jgi:hypothetical protein
MYAALEGEGNPLLAAWFHWIIIINYYSN